MYNPLQVSIGISSLAASGEINGFGFMFFSVPSRYYLSSSMWRTCDTVTRNGVGLETSSLVIDLKHMAS